MNRVLIFLLSLLTVNHLSAQPSLAVKCSPTLQLRTDDAAPGNFALFVSDLPTFQTWAMAEGFEILRTYRPANIIVLRTSQKDFLEKILPRPDVAFADRGDAEPQEELPVPGHNLFVNKFNVAHAVFPHLNGDGITIAVKEYQFDSADVDFKNRVIPPLNAMEQLTSHANIMATLVGGAGNSDPAGRGVAWGARLVSSGFTNLLPDDDAVYTAQDVSVQNHSYGVDIENYYGTGALAYDHSVATHPALLHVFSAGNKGLETSNSGIYANVPGFSNLTGNFKMAKNALLVGAVDSFGAVAPFSSHGPAHDGRLKPDLVAFGQDGSSGAAALVSGAGAAVQQAFWEQTDSLPTAAFVRAVLLNSADDVAPRGPDFFSGFGNLNFKNALQTVVNQQFETGAAANGETQSFNLELPANVHHLKITLVWDDVPAAPNVTISLVNDLDLKAIAPDGSVWLPWSLSTFPHPDSLLLPAVRRRDSLNNVEQVTLDFPQPGQYAMQVFGSKILTASQKFSLVWDWKKADEFSWSFPQKNDPAVAAHDVLLRWENTFSDTAGQLEYRVSGAADWMPIDTVVNLEAGYYRWFVPDIFAEAQLRMRVGGQSFESDTFLIARELRMKIGFNCPDSVFLFWNAAAPQASYLLSGLGSRYLEPLMVLSDTFAVLNKADFPQPRFSVTPAGESGKLGLRSAAPDIGEQGVGCWFENFLAELNDDFQVDLKLSVGTVYGIRALNFEKMEAGQFVSLKNWQPLTSEYFEFTDEFPQQGVNRYRAHIELENGGVLFSDTVEVYFLNDKKLLVFPNPVAPRGRLKVLSDSPEEVAFVLFDVLGKLILEKKLEEPREEIRLPGLPRGVYFWGTRVNGKLGKIGGAVAVE